MYMSEYDNVVLQSYTKKYDTDKTDKLFDFFLNFHKTGNF